MKIKDLFEEKVDYSLFKNNLHLELQGDILWRGTDRDNGEWTHFEDENDSPFSIRYVKAKTTTRTSQFYNSLMFYASTYLPGWDKLPPRNSSVICTPSSSHSESFGNKSTIIIPADNVSIYAWAPNDFNHLARDNDEFKAAYAVLEYIKGYIHSAPIRSMEDALKYAADLDKSIDERSPSTFHDLEEQGNSIRMVLKGTSAVETLKNFTPEKAGIKLIDSIDEFPESKTPAEIWFKGDHILIDTSKMPDSETVNLQNVYKTLFGGK